MVQDRAPIRMVAESQMPLGHSVCMLRMFAELMNFPGCWALWAFVALFWGSMNGKDGMMGWWSLCRLSASEMASFYVSCFSHLLLFLQ